MLGNWTNTGDSFCKEYTRARSAETKSYPLDEAGGSEPDNCGEQSPSRASSTFGLITSDRGFDIDRVRSLAFSAAEQGFPGVPSASSACASPCHQPSLPTWPERDPAAFERGKALLGSMEMDPMRFSRDDLCHLAIEIFEAAGLPDELAADVGRVRRFILAVRESMYDNAYHNFYHVFDVTQTASVLARRTGTFDRLNAWGRFALLAAAFCHGVPPPQRLFPP